jgi:hypothetical protein
VLEAEVNLDHNALLAGVLAAVAMVVLLLTNIGAYVAVRTFLDFADALRNERARQRPAAGGHRRTAPADAVHTPPLPQRQPEPDLYHPRIGTDAEALQTCRDIWKRSPGGEL